MFQKPNIDEPSVRNKRNSRFPYLILAWNEGKGKRPHDQFTFTLSRTNGH